MACIDASYSSAPCNTVSCNALSCVQWNVVLALFFQQDPVHLANTCLPGLHMHTEQQSVAGMPLGHSSGTLLWWLAYISASQTPRFHSQCSTQFLFSISSLCSSKTSQYLCFLFLKKNKRCLSRSESKILISPSSRK